MNGLKQTFSFKSERASNQLMFISPSLMIMLAFVVSWAEKRNIDVVITSLIRTPEENIAVGAKSETHVEGRAVDLSIRPEFGWTNGLLATLQNELVDNFGDSIAALVWEDGELVPRPMVVHDAGSGPHIHLQVRP